MHSKEADYVLTFLILSRSSQIKSAHGVNLTPSPRRIGRFWLAYALAANATSAFLSGFEYASAMKMATVLMLHTKREKSRLKSSSDQILMPGITSLMTRRYMTSAPRIGSVSSLAFPRFSTAVMALMRIAMTRRRPKLFRKL
jgi:hypothetical protein